MRHFALTALLSVAGLAACGKNPLGPGAATATPLAKSIAAAPKAAPSKAVPPKVAGRTKHAAATKASSLAGASATDASDCVQEGENTDQCGSQVEDATPDGAPESPEGTPETPGETPGQP